MSDIKEIKKLQKMYGYYQDYCQWQKIIDLFTDNDPSVEEADRDVYIGKESVRRYFIDLLGGGPDKVIKPDAPPTAYFPYPPGYHVPFSFKHPITGK